MECTFPRRGPKGRIRCGRKAVAVYHVGGSPEPRCKSHDGEDARREAAGKGIRREALEVTQGRWWERQAVPA